MRHLAVVCFDYKPQNIVLNNPILRRKLARINALSTAYQHTDPKKQPTTAQTGTKKAIATGRNSQKSKHLQTVSKATQYIIFRVFGSVLNKIWFDPKAKQANKLLC